MVHVVELLFSSDEVETPLNVLFCRRRRFRGISRKRLYDVEF